MANRLQRVLDKIIDNNQHGYIKGRSISDATTSMFELMRYCSENKIDGGILAVDMEKAFDSMDRTFLIEILKKLGFGEYFIKLTRKMKARL